MARYLIRREREMEVTRTVTAEAEIEIEEGATEQQIKRAAERLSESRWTEVEDWEDNDRSVDFYEIVERLDDKEPEVRGTPQDYGLLQASIF